jgi:ABC-type spermidine/putrescine transport system permease subunit II
MKEQRNKVLTERIASRWVRVHTAIVLFFLVAPILAIIPLSFNSGSYFSYPLQGFSLRWYEQALTSPDWQRSLLNSIGIGAASTLIATCLGTLAALGLSRSQFPLRSVIMPIIISPMIVPFATSFDEVIVILFIGGPDQRTVPRQMWSGIRDSIDPSILAVATMLIVFAVLLFASINWLRGRAAAASRALV